MKKRLLIIIALLLIPLFSTQAASLQCGRVVDDIAAFGHIREFGSGFTGEWYPAVFPLTTSPHSGDGAYKINTAWWWYTVPGQNDFLRWMGSGWVNTSQNTSFGWKFGDYVPVDHDMTVKPVKVETVETTGNLVCWREEVNGAAKLVHFTLSQKPYCNYLECPHLFVKGTSLNRYTGEIGLWQGDDIYFPNLANVTDLYLEMDYIEPYPALPMTVTALTNLNVREHPTTAASVVRAIPIGTQVTISQYHWYGSDTWGFIGDGWIKIEDTYSWGTYNYTTFSMDTDPPLNEYPQPVQPLSDFTSVQTNTPVPTETVEPTQIATGTPTMTATAQSHTATPVPTEYENGWNDAIQAIMDALIEFLKGFFK